MCCKCASHVMSVQQEDDSTSLLWVTVRLLMFLLPFLMLLRVVTAMREIRLNRNSPGHAADHSFAAILWVSASMTFCHKAFAPLHCNRFHHAFETVNAARVVAQG